MNTFDRHLLREWLQMLGLVMIATCGLLLVHVLLDDFRDLREYGARGTVLLRYIAITMPGFINVVLPLALLISLLFVLGKLHRANELTAMRAAGVGYFRLMLPIWGVGILCCGLAWWLNSTVVPWSVEQSRILRDNLQFRRDAGRMSADRVGAVYSVAFDNQAAGRMWFFNRYSQYSHHGYGVSVSELDAQRRETRRIVAAEAWFDPVRQGWEFRNGRVLTFDPERGVLEGAVPSAPFQEKFVPSFKEDPQLMILVDRRPVDLSLFQLRALMDYFQTQHSPKSTAYEVRYYGLVADALGPLIVIAIAIPFAVTGMRVNPAVGVSKAIGLFFLYYLLANLGASLATKEIVTPEVGAWVPNICLAGFAGWLFVRLR